METEERLRLEYEQTSQLLRTLTDIRFKLLAFVPTIAGASVGLVGHPRPAADLLGVGLLGLVATLGVLLYELRNSETYDAALDRAAELERALGLAGPLGASFGGWQPFKFLFGGRNLAGECLESIRRRAEPRCRKTTSVSNTRVELHRACSGADATGEGEQAPGRTSAAT